MSLLSPLLNIFKSPLMHNVVWVYDRLVSLVTGSSRSERILLDLDLVDCLVRIFKESEPVDYKIHDPKILTEFQVYCQSSLSPETLAELQNGSKNHDALTDAIITQLEINVRYRHLVLDAVIQMCKFYSDLKVYEEKCNIQVSEDISDHKKTLLNVWSNLVSHPAPKSLNLCKHDDETTWGLLGFQKPLTDFRKTGLLGLLCLDYLTSKYTELARRAHSLSRNEHNWFPFALVSINVTSWVLDFYNENVLNRFSYNNDMEPLEIFYAIHTSFFFNFVKYYAGKGSLSVLDFNNVASKYKEEVLNKLNQPIESGRRPDSMYGSTLVNNLKQELSTFNL